MDWIMSLQIDNLIFEFMKNNGLTVMALYMILRGIAAESPWTWDEKLVDIIGSAFDVFKAKKE